MSGYVALGLFLLLVLVTFVTGVVNIATFVGHLLRAAGQ